MAKARKLALSLLAPLAGCAITSAAMQRQRRPPPTLPDCPPATGGASRERTARVPVREPDACNL